MSTDAPLAGRMRHSFHGQFPLPAFIDYAVAFEQLTDSNFFGEYLTHATLGSISLIFADG
jgi:hypothetical protein